MRPTLRPALRRVWRDRETLQLGLDPDGSVVLTGLTPPVARLLEELDGCRTLEQTYGYAARLGLGAAEVDAVLALLAEHGVLEDAVRYADGLPLTAVDQDRVRPDLASLAAVWEPADGGRALLTARTRAVVTVHGGGRVGSAVAALLAAAGVGRVVPTDRRPVSTADGGPAGFRWNQTGRRRETAVRAAVRQAAPAVLCSLPPGRTHPDVAVVVPECRPDPELADRLVRDGTPHLFADVRETVGLVGPLTMNEPRLPCHDTAYREGAPQSRGVRTDQ